MAYKVVCCDDFSAVGVNELATSGLKVEQHGPLSEAKLIDALQGANGLIVRSGTQVSRAAIEATPTLQIIARAGIGTDNIDVEAARELGVFVINAPTGNTVSAAELTFAMILALARNITRADRSMRAHRWDKKSLKGLELRGKTLGLIGLGRIGREVARRARAFGMECMGFDPFLPNAEFERIKVDAADLEDVLTNADVISIHTPLNESTENLIRKETLAMMKPKALLINCSRGGVVNESDLKEALEKNVIGGAALDVFTEEPLKQNPFADLENCITTPHLGASTAEAQEAVGLEVAKQVCEFFNMGFLPRAVNLPGGVQENGPNLGRDVRLATRLGGLLQDMLNEPLMTLEIIANARKSKIVKLATLFGCFERVVGDRVSIVNAESLAQDRGIQVRETFGDDSLGDSTLCLKGTGKEKEVSVIATIEKDNTIRVNNISGFRFDVLMDSTLLLVDHLDQPGVIANLCAKIAELTINIAGLQNSRNEKGTTAMTLLRVDEPLTKDQLKAIQEVKAVNRVRMSRIS